MSECFKQYKAKLRQKASNRRVSGIELASRLSGMDDPTPDPEFDAQRAAMPEQQALDQQKIMEALRGVAPEMQQFMRTRGVGEPDWAPLEGVIPPSHLGDWMFMGYGDHGVREYKHQGTRRYLKLLPREELQPGWEGPGDHLLNRQHIPFANFRTQDGRVITQPVDMNFALSHAYEGAEETGHLPNPYPQGYPHYDWEGMEVPPWERPPYQQQQPGPSDIDPYADLR